MRTAGLALVVVATLAGLAPAAAATPQSIEISSGDVKLKAVLGGREDTLLLGRRATEMAVKALPLESYSIITFATPARVPLLGWSTGAVSLLWSVRPRGRHHDDKPDLRSAVAFYPGCTRLDATAWSARVPTLILIGGSDDVSSARSCERMVAGARGRSARATIIVYPGAYHDFDHPNRAVQVRTGYTFSVDGSGRVHTGSNATARGDAHRRVLSWLER